MTICPFHKDEPLQRRCVAFCPEDVDCTTDQSKCHMYQYRMELKKEGRDYILDRPHLGKNAEIEGGL